MKAKSGPNVQSGMIIFMSSQRGRWVEVVRADGRRAAKGRASPRERLRMRSEWDFKPYDHHLCCSRCMTEVCSVGTECHGEVSLAWGVGHVPVGVGS